MHGLCENSKKIRRMLSVPSSVNYRRVIAAVGDPDAAGTSKDVRKINIGDCALFKPPQESPPFIGIIRSLGPDKETNLQLGVTWLYRPSDIQLPKGVAIEAAPNEVFYSFHRDEIPAASLLHPCKVAFLPKGVELPSGVSSFVCRRVYDTTNKRLWWLTDKDFINEEVDKLLQKTKQEMRATVQPQGVRSPRPMNSPRSTSQLKHSPDSVQNSTSPFASYSKGKKRERSDQGSELVKRERYSKADDGNSSVLSSEVLLKSEIAKITEKGGIVDSKAVERLVQLMQSDKSEKRLDIPCRSLLVGVLAATNKDDCLNRFVQLRGLPVLDEWLQEVHKGKVRDSSSPRDHDKSVMDFLLTLLHALERLPVNLNALQMCNIGKSVNHLRSHRNSDIQKKARSLVELWKKRVEAEMNINDSRSATSQVISLPARVRNDISHGITRRSSASDAAIKNSPSQLSSSKSAPAKSIEGEVARCASASPTIVKLPSSSASTIANMRDAHLKISVTNSSSELPLSTIKDEKSSSSSHSQTNSPCSSDHVKNLGPAVKEDARSSNSGSSLNNSSGSASGHRKAANDRKGVVASAIHRDGGSMKSSSLTRISASEKFSRPSSRGKAGDLPVADSNNHKLIVKISNRGRSTAQNVHGGCLDDLSSMNSRTSSPVVPEKLGQSERSPKEKSGGYPNNTMSDVITESWQSNDLKDRAAVFDEADGSPSEALDSGNCRTGGETKKLTDGEKAESGPNVESNSRKLQDSSLSSINALIESCVEYSEANLPMSAGDIVGMNLLASVAAGEISKSPAESPERSTSVAEDSCRDYSARSKPNGDIEVSLVEPSLEAQKQNPTCASVHDREKDDQPRLHGKDLLSSGDSCFRTDEKRDESEPPSTLSPANAAGSEGSDKAHESKPAIGNDSHVWTPQGVTSLAAKVKICDGSLMEENHERSVVAGSVSSADVDEKNVPKEKQESKVVMKKQSSTMASMEPVGRKEKVGVSSCINDLLPGQFNDSKDDDIDVGGDRILSQSANEKVKLEKIDPSLHKKEDSVLDSGAYDQNIMNNKVDLMDRDTTVAPATKTNSYSPTLDNDVVSDSNDSVLPARDDEVAVDEHHSGVKTSSPAMGDKKVEFDLNEGFDVDDNKDEDLPSTVSPGRLNCQLPSFSVASTSVSLPASVTVASAAKGPFMPPEDLLRNKAELGWRGSAATSAFRPAEPRKVSEIAPGVNDEQISDVNNEKQGRARFEIDLNVADERTIDDMDCQINDFQTSKTAEFETSDGPTGVASRSNGGGLDLDLNRVDEAPDLTQPLPPIHRFEMPRQPMRLSSSSAPANSDSGRRDFDLNNGPTADEFPVDSLSFNKHLRSNIYSQPSVGFRINSTEMGTLNPWYTAGTAYSAMPIPAGLPDRVQPFPIADTGGVPPKMWLGPAEAMPFNPDMYRGPVLSSPAVPFPSSQFQYPVFPLGTSFPLPSSSLPGGSTAFMDLSSGGRFCIPAVGSQLLGTALSVPSQYPRPYVSISDVSNSVAMDNAQKWGRQGLDLNAGPDSEPIMSRPMPSLGPLALTDEQSRLYTLAGGAMKRKEPDGGWDMDRLSYKQPSWQ
ncbi:uncharacterized protein LOC141652644 isoform X2 [Silene latifolia]|uniref:uncharacterized protein LOC141652644 isoform X2 n=1 Tax=Silene latifolia TaxID=37657 RepID=UPI003D779BB1